VPTRTAPTLVEILSRQPGYPGINAHTLDGTLRRLGMTRRQLKRPKKRVRRWSAKHVNDLWQGDATDGVWLPDPRDPEEKKIKTKLFLWIDDVSRLVPHAEFFYDEKLPRMERTMKLGILRRGLPGAVYTDNGAVFRASVFNASLANLGIRRIRSRPRAPRGRGKVERMFSVIQEHFFPEVYAAGIRRLEDLNEALWAWLECIYHKRTHSEIKKTPLDAYRDGLTHVRPADPVDVARAFLWRATRKVSGNGFISLLGNSYSVDPAWSGQKLELRFDPFDLSRIDVYRDARPVARAQVRKLSRGLALDFAALPLAPVVEPSGINFLDALRNEYRRQRAAEIGEIPFRDALRGAENKEEA
jgi:transposase InsO family protein